MFAKIVAQILCLRENHFHVVLKISENFKEIFDIWWQLKKYKNRDAHKNYENYCLPSATQARHIRWMRLANICTISLHTPTNSPLSRSDYPDKRAGKFYCCKRITSIQRTMMAWKKLKLFITWIPPTTLSCVAARFYGNSCSHMKCGKKDESTCEVFLSSLETSSNLLDKKVNFQFFCNIKKKKEPFGYDKRKVKIKYEWGWEDIFELYYKKI